MTDRLRIRRASDGRTVDLPADAQIGAGGEGRVFRVPQWPGSVAKLYHQPTEERARKVRAMVAQPPRDPGGTHAALCWPTDALHDTRDRFLGFLMPMLPRFSPVFALYNPGARRQGRPLTTWADLHGVARQVATVMDAVHAIDAVVGDINESNTVVDDDLRVTLVDCDSFRIRDPHTGALYRSPVAKPEYTAPELQGKSMAEVQQTLEDDRFGLAVLVFQLLMEGMHPYEGVLLGPGEPEPYGARIAAGSLPWAHGRGGRYGLKPLAVSVDVLDPALRSAFMRCFVDGHSHPSARPAAATWATLLRGAEANMRACSANDQHRYGRHLVRCPWCDRRDALGGLDPFPSRESVAAGTHLAAPPVRRSAPPRAAAWAAPRRTYAAPPRVPLRAPANVPLTRSGRRWVALSLLLLAAGVAAAVVTVTRQQGVPLDEVAREQEPESPEPRRTSPIGDAAESLLEELVKKGDAQSMRKAAAILTATGHRTAKGRTGLMLVSRSGDVNDVKHQLEVGDDPNARDKDGFTALTIAASEGHGDVIRALLAGGANADLLDAEGYSALLFAAMDGHQDAVRALLAAGADPRLATKAGWSPLISASAHGHVETVRALLDAGAPVEHQDVNGCTALMAAANEGSERTVELLLDRGARPDVETGCGNAFAMANDSGCPGCVRLIGQALSARRAR